MTADAACSHDVLAPGGPSAVAAARKHGIVVADDIADVAALYDDDVRAVVWRRGCSSALRDEAERAVLEVPQRLIAVVDAGTLGGLSSPWFAAFPALTAEIGSLADVFATLTGAAAVGVRLARLTAPMCPRFHVDHVAVRAVCTLTGPGTELAAAAPVAPVERAVPAWRAAAGDVVWMRGELLAPASVHRSPGGSQPRLVITLDVVDQT
jgi:hypothetical protein